MTRTIERVVTATGHMVHLYYPHAHRTACGMDDSRVWTADPLFDQGKPLCQYCERYAGVSHNGDADG